MRRLLPVVVLALGACENYHHRSSDYSEYYKQPAESKSSKNLERKKILHWKADPRAKALIGVLERNEVTLEGSREPREHYFIYDEHLKPVGLITVEGKFYRFDEHGRRVLVNEYVIGDDPQRKMFMTGLKVFFGLPLTDNLGLEDIDPYGDF